MSIVGHNLGKITQVFPPKLVSTILRALKRQLRMDGVLSALEVSTTGPVPEEPLFEEFEGGPDPMEFELEGEFWDDVNGGWLDPTLVRAARDEEVQWMETRKVFEIEKADVCWRETGRKPVTLKWVDTDKGDWRRPRYRSRLVAREIRRGKQRALPDAMLFSAMPPLEAMKGLCSLLVTRQRSEVRRKPLKIGIWDVSRAHLYGVAQRNIFTEVPEELAKARGLVGGDHCARLLRSLYGTQNASNL